MNEYARPEVLIEPDELVVRMKEAGVRLVDCDGPDQYRRAHIPGCVVYAGDRYFKDRDDRRFIMPPGQFAAAMLELGIGDYTEVVAYDASGSLNSGRLWWCLNYYGHPNVRVLNGGWNRWLSEGRPLSMELVKAPRLARFTATANESLRATASDIMAALGQSDVVLLDVRSDAEWVGANNRGNARAGHMPGAVHIEWLNNVDPEGERRLRRGNELRAMFEAAGVTPDKEVITVCQAGIRAAQAAMTLSLLGYPRVRVYDGSFQEWGNREDTPLV